MPAIADELETKVGGLPAWAWGGGVVAGVLLFRHWRAGQDAANTAGDTATVTGDPTGGTLDTTGTYDPLTDPNNTDPMSAYLAGDPTNPAYGVGAVPSGVPAPVTNAQWARLSADYLIAQGDDPILVSTALYRYIRGQSLNAAQRAVVDLALTHFGTPPQGVNPVTNTANPPPTAPTAPNLHGQEVAGRRIAISWNAVPGATVYLVFRNGVERTITRGTHYTTPRLKVGAHHLYVLPIGTKAGHRSNTVSVTVK